MKLITTKKFNVLDRREESEPKYERKRKRKKKGERRKKERKRGKVQGILLSHGFSSCRSEHSCSDTNCRRGPLLRMS
jgi:SOS response regulatory protein OraA/RecX